MTFSDAALALLERIVEKGDVDGWGPSQIMNDPTYSKIFSGISPGTFRSRLTRIRKKYHKQGSRKSKANHYFLSVLTFQGPLKMRETLSQSNLHGNDAGCRL